MKKTYTRPQIIVEEFSANEYIAACGDSGTTYKFVCDAAGGNVYLETNGLDGLQTDRTFIGNNILNPFESLNPSNWVAADRELGGYGPCGITHDASSSSDFSSGYVRSRGGVQNVIVWTAGGTNIHCTTNLNQDSWETSKS